MDFAVEELSEVRRKINIKIPEDIVSEKIDHAYRELNRQIKMPGFRPGKIPMKILEKQVPVAAMTDMWQDLMQEYYEKALSETGIIPAGSPEIDHSDIKDVKKDAPLSFSVILDIKPTIKFKNYKGLKYKKVESTVSEDDLKRAIREHLLPFGQLESHPDDHALEWGDHVAMDFEGFLGGEPLEQGTAKDYNVCLGEKKMIAGFEDQVIGHKKGDSFDVKVTLPQNWNNKMRRVSLPIPGKEGDSSLDLAVFKVEIQDTKKMVLPELTDEFVKKQGEQSVESFKSKVKAGIQGLKDHAEEVRIKQDIFNYLVDEHDIAAPESLVKQELKFMIEGTQFQIEQSGMKLEDSGFEPERAEKEWRERAEFNAKGYVILDGIAGQENLNVSQSDMEEEYKRLAEETKKSPEDIKKSLFSNPDYMNQTTQRIRGQKALQLIYSHCEFEYVDKLEENETLENQS